MENHTQNPALLLSTLHARHVAWVSNKVAKGSPSGFCKCPYCNGTMQHVLPTRDETWTSCTTCTHCGAMYLKQSTQKGVTAERIPT